MKTWEDLQTRLKKELEQWFIKQCQNNFADFYLYYLPSSAEHDGGLLICEDYPPNKEYLLADGRRINKGATIDQNYNFFIPIVRRIPVLSWHS